MEDCIRLNEDIQRLKKIILESGSNGNSNSRQILEAVGELKDLSFLAKKAVKRAKLHSIKLCRDIA